MSAKTKAWLIGVGFLKAGINLNVDFPLLNMGLIEISHSHFKQSKNSILIPLLYLLGVFLGIFGKRYNSFSQRIGKIRRNKKC